MRRPRFSRWNAVDHVTVRAEAHVHKGLKEAERSGVVVSFTETADGTLIVEVKRSQGKVLVHTEGVNCCDRDPNVDPRVLAGLLVP